MPGLNKNHLNTLSQAVAECKEKAILNALVQAVITTGFNRRTVYSLADFLETRQAVVK